MIGPLKKVSASISGRHMENLSVQDSQAEARCWGMLKEVCHC